ncbi:tumor necrosis factor receptor superfamily member 14-like isoform X2 [Lepisosteus oculatus]|uniref:tumor necrosis factor receptor superfamily member 14-like isoform X2 n=1 Tax=Lepisosteus oculatus TaxID=7918 RepID=UPI00371BF005
MWRLDIKGTIQATKPIVFLLLVCKLSDAMQCGPAEYLVNGECCPMCPIGSRVLRHCTEFSSTSCIPCVGSTYTDQPNGLLSCFQCKVCDPGLRTLHGCTNQKDAVCWVLSGYYCIDQADGGCKAARPHTVCTPGQWVKQPGSDYTDTECEDCTQNSYSDGLFTSCKPHTDCKARGLQEIRPGTSASDVECGEMSTPVVTPIVTVLAIAISIASAVVIFLVLKKKIPCSKEVKQDAKKSEDSGESSELVNSGSSQGNRLAPRQLEETEESQNSLYPNIGEASLHLSSVAVT